MKWEKIGYCFDSCVAASFEKYQEFKNYLKTLGIKHRPTLPENPQNNEVENVNRRIRKAVDLAKITKED